MVSFDDIFERMLKDNGYPTDLTKIPSDERQRIMSDHPKSLRTRARNLMKKQMRLMAKNQTGMIFDGTGQATGPYLQRKAEMEAQGYDVYLMYVDVDLPTALARNAARSRRLPDNVVDNIWQNVKQNKKQYEREFGNDMIVIDNSSNAPPEKSAQAAINRFISAPIKNKIGQSLLQKHVSPIKMQGSQPRSNMPDRKVRNPVTGNDILFKSAINYPAEHPAHKAAAALIPSKEPSTYRKVYEQFWHTTDDSDT